MKSVKCVVIGDGGVGKSSLLISYTTNTFPQDYIPTVFDNYSTTIAISDNNEGGSEYDESNDGEVDDEEESEPHLFRLNLWDTAGQEEYDSLRPLSYPQTDIFLICFSVSEQSSFSNAKEKWFNEVMQIANFTNSEIYRNKKKNPILLVGTKSDLRDNESERARIRASDSSYISKKQINKLVEECNLLGYVECSAATQTGVSDVFETAVRHMIFKEEQEENMKKVAKVENFENIKNIENTETIEDTENTEKVENQEALEKETTSTSHFHNDNSITNPSVIKDNNNNNVTHTKTNPNRKSQTKSNEQSRNQISTEKNISNKDTTPAINTKVPKKNKRLKWPMNDGSNNKKNDKEKNCCIM